MTPYAPDAWAYGGIPRVVGSLARGLARRGHEVTVCTTDACDASARLPRRDHASEGSVDVRVFPNVSNRLAYHLQLFLPLGMHTFLGRAARRFGVAHLHACRNIPGVIAAYHLRRAGIPYVLAPNGTAPIIERRHAAKRVFDAVAGDRVVRGASRLLAVSDAERGQLLALGIDASRIRVIPNPIHVDEHGIHPHASVAGRFRERYRFGGQPIVLFLGRLSPRKRLDVLIRAFAQLCSPIADSVRLVIAGNDMGAEAAAHRLVGELGIQEHVTFTGLLTQGERIEALVDADVTVYPSEHEIFGLVPFEALLAGTPVVVADDSGCGDLVGATGGGLVVPVNDVNTLARAIGEVLAYPAIWRLKAQRAQPRIRASYGADVVCGELEAVYQELVQARREQRDALKGVPYPIWNEPPERAIRDPEQLACDGSHVIDRGRGDSRRKRFEDGPAANGFKEPKLVRDVGHAVLIEHQLGLQLRLRPRELLARYAVSSDAAQFLEQNGLDRVEHGSLSCRDGHGVEERLLGWQHAA